MEPCAFWRYHIFLWSLLVFLPTMFFASSVPISASPPITHSPPTSLLIGQKAGTLKIKYIAKVKGVYFLVVGHILIDGRVVVLQRRKLRYFKPEAWRVQDAYTMELSPEIEVLATSKGGRWLAYISKTMSKSDGEMHRTLVIEDLVKRNFRSVSLVPFVGEVKALHSVGYGLPELIVERFSVPIKPNRPLLLHETLIAGTITKGLVRYVLRRTTSVREHAEQQAIVQVEHKIINAVVKAGYTPYPTVREGGFKRNELTDQLAMIAYRSSDATGLVRVLEQEDGEVFIAVQKGISLGTISYPFGKDIRRAFVGTCFVVLVDTNFEVPKRTIEVWRSNPLKCITRIVAVELVSVE